MPKSTSCYARILFFWAGRLVGARLRRRSAALRPCRRCFLSGLRMCRLHNETELQFEQIRLQILFGVDCPIPRWDLAWWGQMLAEALDLGSESALNTT